MTDLGVGVAFSDQPHDIAFDGSQRRPAELRALTLAPAAAGIGDRIGQRQLAARVPAGGRVRAVQGG